MLNDEHKSHGRNTMKSNESVSNLVEFANDNGLSIAGVESIPELSIAEILTSNPFDENDEDLYYAQGKFITMAKVNGKVFHHRQVSEQYRVTPYADTIRITLDSILQQSPEFGKPEIKLNFVPGGGRMFAEYRFPEVPQNLAPSKKKQDPVIPRIIVKDSIDLSGRFSAVSGVFRLVCSNGMIVAHPDFKAEKFFMMHKSHAYNLDNALESLNTSLKKISEATDLWKAYMKEKITTLQLADVMEASNMSLRAQEKVLQLPIIGTDTTLLNSVKQGRVNAWTVLNALTQFATHEVENVTASVDLQESALAAMDNTLGLTAVNF